VNAHNKGKVKKEVVIGTKCHTQIKMGFIEKEDFLYNYLVLSMCLDLRRTVWNSIDSMKSSMSFDPTNFKLL